MYTDKLENYNFNKILKACFFCSTFVGILLIRFELNNDIWFLLNSGRYIIMHGIPYIEPFTIHENFHFVMQQWLTSVIFWCVYSKLGALGLMMLVSLTYIAIVFTVFKVCFLISDKNLQISVIVSMIIGILISIFMQTRPQIFSGLLLLLELYCLELYVQKKKLKSLFFLPIISLLFINLHAALWPMMIIILIPYVIDSFSFKYKKLQGEGFSRKPLIFCLTGIIVVGVCNPYEIEAMTYLFQSYGYPEINMFVQEMKPLEVTGIIGKISFTIMVVVGIIYTKIKTKLRFCLLTIGTIYMAMVSVRSVFLFFILGIFPLAYGLKDFYPIKKNVSKMNSTNNKLRIKLTILLLVVTFMMIFQYNEKILQELFEMSFIKKAILVLSEMSLLIYFIKVWRKQCANGYSFKRYCLEKIIVIPIGISIFSIILISHVNCKISNNEPLCKPAVQYLLNHTSKEKVILWSNYDDGGYAEYYGLCTYIDPRAEIFLKSNNRKQDVLLEYKALQTGRLYYKEFVERYSFTHFLTYKQDLLFTYLAYDADFKMIYQDNNYRLYEKVIY